MNLQLSLIELVVADMAATLAFYRRLGLDIPAGADQQPHVDIEIKGGLRIAFDTEDTIRSFDSGWTRPSGGHRAALAFACDSPAEVDAAYAELTGPATRATWPRGTPSGACVTPSCTTPTGHRSTCSPCSLPANRAS